MLPWPVWPLAGQSGLGQNTVARSMSILLALSSGLPRVWLDLRFCYKSASPRFSAELPGLRTAVTIPLLADTAPPRRHAPQFFPLPPVPRPLRLVPFLSDP